MDRRCTERITFESDENIKRYRLMLQEKDLIID